MFFLLQSGINVMAWNGTVTYVRFKLRYSRVRTSSIFHTYYVRPYILIPSFHFCCTSISFMGSISSPSSLPLFSLFFVSQHSKQHSPAGSREHSRGQWQWQAEKRKEKHFLILINSFELSSTSLEVVP